MPIPPINKSDASDISSIIPYLLLISSLTELFPFSALHHASGAPSWAPTAAILSQLAHLLNANGTPGGDPLCQLHLTVTLYKLTSNVLDYYEISPCGGENEKEGGGVKEANAAHNLALAVVQIVGTVIDPQLRYSNYTR
jgi:hypothetical protein